MSSIENYPQAEETLNEAADLMVQTFDSVDDPQVKEELVEELNETIQEVGLKVVTVTEAEPELPKGRFSGLTHAELTNPGPARVTKARRRALLNRIRENRGVIVPPNAG